MAGGLLYNDSDGLFLKHPEEPNANSIQELVAPLVRVAISISPLAF
jgi:hypothetical protein